MVKKKYWYAKVYKALANNRDGFSPGVLEQFEFMVAVAFNSLLDYLGTTLRYRHRGRQTEKQWI